jgi:hypothetical protein
MMSYRGMLGNNDITWGQANSTDMPLDQKVNKAKELISMINGRTREH